MSTIKLPKKFVSKYPHKFAKGKAMYLRGQRILPKPITGKESLPDLIDRTFLAYNAARLQEACQLLTERMLASPTTTIGLSLAGAMTPAGLGSAALIPLIKAGFVDWIVSTGANLYHDMHHAMNLPLWKGTPFLARYPVAQVRRRPHLRHPARLRRRADAHRRHAAPDSGSAGISKRDGHGGTPPPDRQVLRRVRAADGSEGRFAAGGRLPGRRAVLLARRRATRPSA